MASLNMGSVNFGEDVYINTLPDIRYWAARMREAKAVPELEVFNPSMIESAYALRDEGVLVDPLRFNIALGFPSSLSAAPRHLTYLSGMLERDTAWGFLHEGMTDFRVLTAALGLGAQVLRVGFEDGGYIRPDRPARTNAELVEHLVTLIRASGKDVASPAEAREILGVPPLSVVD
jgi:3-keto-5-aminohexanoate cleavage enzyme